VVVRHTLELLVTRDCGMGVVAYGGQTHFGVAGNKGLWYYGVPSILSQMSSSVFYVIEW
jgi:hypothetical protein